MTTQYQTAYRRLKGDIAEKNLRRLYTPTRAELLFARRTATRRNAQLAILIHLKTAQYLGYFTTLADVPDAIVRHIASALDSKGVPPKKVLENYDKSGAKRAHIAALRTYRNVRAFDMDRDTVWLTAAAETAAETKNYPDEIVNVLLEELLRQRCEFPGYQYLERMASAAQGRVHDGYLERLSATVTPAARRQIDALLTRKANATGTGWNELKAEPKKPTNQKIRFSLQLIERLKKLADLLPPVEIPRPKLRFFQTFAASLDAAKLARYAPEKRYGLATIYLRARHGQAFDDAAELFIKMMLRLDKTGRNLLQEHQLGAMDEVDALVAQLKSILEAYQIDGTDTQKVNAIDGCLVDDVQALLDRCKAHMAFAGKNHLPFLLKPYGTLRPLLLQCVALADLHSARDDQGVAPLLPVLLSLRAVKRDPLIAAEHGLRISPDLDWLPKDWRDHVLVKAFGGGEPQLDRRYLELAILFRVFRELRSGDLYVPRGQQFDDYRESLVDNATLTKELEPYGTQTGITVEPKKFTADLKAALIYKSGEVDGRFADNEHASLVDGRLILTRIRRAEPTPELKKLDQAITEALEPTGIVDVLIDTTRWLKLHQVFRPVSGERGRIKDLQPRVVSTLFCYGCNLGATQTARSVKGISRKQVAWLGLHNVGEETLDDAIQLVINAYNRYDLIRYWGNTKHAAADGTKWSMYEQNLISENHVRYGFYPVDADTSKKAHHGPKGVSWRSDEHSVQSSSVRLSS